MHESFDYDIRGSDLQRDRSKERDNHAMAAKSPSDLPSQDTSRIFSKPDPVSPESSSLSSLPQWIKTEKTNQDRQRE
ncbi:hypothetical protein KY290_030558 [Solanum tuberosum]|uniref:Uncharacterized protein n=1 Tax=Solanum tuberosum TaxID=4113 RepID=A0ABQ7UA69_SOLTU|nr:hypothetical protein KY284_029580 [Solanum tuberosum]KAH0742565.1 hypothetical protein KY290_030558 [Solanum tuberosum]